MHTPSLHFHSSGTQHGDQLRLRDAGIAASVGGIVQRGHHFFTVRLVIPDSAALLADELSLFTRMATDWSSSNPVRPGRTRQSAGKREERADTAAGASGPKAASDARSHLAGDGQGAGGSSSARDQNSAGRGGGSSERKGRDVFSEEDEDDAFDDDALGEEDAEIGVDGSRKPRARGSGGSWGPFVSNVDDTDDTDHNPP